MKLALLLTLAAALQGCGDSDEVWSLDISRSDASHCALTKLTLFVTDHGDGDFAGSLVSAEGTMRVANKDGGYGVEIDDTRVGVTFAGTFQREVVDGAWPDNISGVGTFTGNDCDGSVALAGISVSREDYIDHQVADTGGYSLGECSELSGEDCPINWGF